MSFWCRLEVGVEVRIENNLYRSIYKGVKLILAPLAMPKVPLNQRIIPVSSRSTLMWGCKPLISGATVPSVSFTKLTEVAMLGL